MNLREYYAQAAIPKSTPTVKPKPWQRVKGLCARLRARKSRKDAAYALTIRPLCEARDGLCRYGYDVAPGNRYSTCAGPSEWAHWGPFRRFLTRGQPPEDRHRTEGSLMLCKFHHQMYDAGQLTIVALTPQLCDGKLHYIEEA